MCEGNCKCEAKCKECKCINTSIKETRWVVFSGTNDESKLNIIEEKLSKFINNSCFDYNYKCLFLPRKVVEEKGFDPRIVDILEKNNVEFVLNKYSSFEECMSNINKEREILANESDKMLIIIPDSEEPSNMYNVEIPMFTKNNNLIFI